MSAAACSSLGDLRKCSLQAFMKILTGSGRTQATTVPDNQGDVQFDLEVLDLAAYGTGCNAKFTCRRSYGALANRDFECA